MKIEKIFVHSFKKNFKNILCLHQAKLFDLQCFVIWPNCQTLCLAAKTQAKEKKAPRDLYKRRWISTKRLSGRVNISSYVPTVPFRCTPLSPILIAGSLGGILSFCLTANFYQNQQVLQLYSESLMKVLWVQAWWMGVVTRHSTQNYHHNKQSNPPE